MKVLLATIFAYPPRGGLGAYIKELKTGLEQNGHHVEILAKHHDEYFLTKSNRQYPLKKKRFGKFLPQNWVGNRAWKFSKSIRDESAKFLDAVQMLDMSQYQVIHAQDIVSASVLRYHKNGLTPLVMTLHGCVTAEYYYFGYIKQRSIGWEIISSFETAVLQQSDQVIVPSQWLVGIYKRCGIPTDNMQVISNGIDVPAFRKRMKKKTGLSSPSNKSIIICTGRLEKVKGQHILLDALARLKKNRSDWVCWIAGRGDAEKELKKKVRRLGLDRNVKFLGLRSDIPALLKQADIYVIPSLEENYPYSLVEAQVAGKAIIASKTGGITEMIEHGKNGLLVPAGDYKKLSQQIEKLLKQPNVQKQLGKEASVRGEKQFSLKTMMKQTLAVYGKVMKSKSADKGEE